MQEKNHIYHPPICETHIRMPLKLSTNIKFQNTATLRYTQCVYEIQNKQQENVVTKLYPIAINRK